MNGLFIVTFVLGIIGAIVSKKKKLIFPMIVCILVAIVSAFLLICAAWLMWAID